VHAHQCAFWPVGIRHLYGEVTPRRRRGWAPGRPPIRIPVGGIVNDDDMDTEQLSDRDKAMLRFESERSKHTARKDEEIRKAFSMSSARYYQLLHVLIARPAAVKHDPILARRLQSGVASRAKARATRVLTARR
jgi:hypothetical protein